MEDDRCWCCFFFSFCQGSLKQKTAHPRTIYERNSDNTEKTANVKFRAVQKRANYVDLERYIHSTYTFPNRPAIKTSPDREEKHFDYPCDGERKCCVKFFQTPACCVVLIDKARRNRTRTSSLTSNSKFQSWIFNLDSIETSQHWKKS